MVEVVAEDSEGGDPPEAVKKRENRGGDRRTIDDQGSVTPCHRHDTSESD